MTLSCAGRHGLPVRVGGLARFNHTATRWRSVVVPFFFPSSCVLCADGDAVQDLAGSSLTQTSGREGRSTSVHCTLTMAQKIAHKWLHNLNLPLPMTCDVEGQGTSGFGVPGRGMQNAAAAAAATIAAAAAAAAATATTTATAAAAVTAAAAATSQQQPQQQEQQQ